MPALLHAIAEGRPASIVFLDVTMKRMGGDVCCKALRDAGFTLPIVAVTGEADTKRLLGIGFSQVIEKPFDKDNLVAALQRWAPTRPS